jgi:imidazolonepropionase-like amidohydrolase
MTTIIHGGPIFTGVGEHLQDGQALLIENDTIQSIDTLENLERKDPGADLIDVGGRTILPGLTDAHRHLISASAEVVSTELLANGLIDGVTAARLTLEEGITSVRDPGCRHYGIFYLRQAIEEGRISGPNIFAAGPNPTSEAAPKSWRNTYIHDPWTMRQAVRQLKRDGADWVKVIVSGRSAESGWKFTQRYLTNDEMLAAADEAHAMGLKISGHVEATEGTQAALDAGFDAIEHGTGITAEMAQVMAERGVFYTPTLSFLHYNDINSVWGPLPPEIMQGIIEYRLEHARSFHCALQAGVKIAVGTDYAGVLPPCHSLFAEMELMVQNGMTLGQVIHAATVTGAEIVGKGNCLGRLLPAYQADIIAVNGNPFEDLNAIKRVDLVMKSGKLEVSKL